MALFDSDFLSHLEYLSLVSKRVFRGQLITQRRTRELGSGIEFSEHREYNAGDDFRYLDWNLYARHDELLLKRFEEQQDLHVYVLLDCSRSMAFGEHAKFDHARRVAAALSYIALADLERVAVTAFADTTLKQFPLTRGKNRILTLLRFLEDLEPGGNDTNLINAASALVHRGHRRGPVILISDLYDPSGFERGVDLLRYHGYEPHVIRVFDPAEAEPPLKGDVDLLDIETQVLRKVTVTERSVREYEKLYGSFVESVERYCRKYSLGYTAATTAVSFDDLILHMMRASGGASGRAGGIVQ
jgi:uncharacterized protein (DUF58 family)